MTAQKGRFIRACPVTLRPQHAEPAVLWLYDCGPHLQLRLRLHVLLPAGYVNAPYAGLCQCRAAFVSWGHLCSIRSNSAYRLREFSIACHSIVDRLLTPAVVRGFPNISSSSRPRYWSMTYLILGPMAGVVSWSINPEPVVQPERITLAALLRGAVACGV